mgnify:CR=1 FL=1
MELPSSDEIKNIIDRSDDRWFWSDGLTYIFHHEVIGSQWVSPSSFNVKLRTFEVNEIKLSDLLNPETVEVTGYQLERIILYDEESKTWSVDEVIDDKELSPLEIQSLPDSAKIIVELINRVGDDLIEQSEPEELMRIDVNKIHNSLRRLLADRSPN